MKGKHYSVLACLMMVFFMPDAQGKEIFVDKRFADSAAILVADASGHILYQWQAEKALIPASILKIITAQLALDKWGEKHRYNTDFYIQGNTLWVKGYGDPFLVSEELDRITRVLADKLEGVSVNSIAIDASYFGAVGVDYRITANDPYNAPLSAVAANFNTVYINKNGDQIVSAEPQTPITTTAITLANDLKDGKHRINVGNAQVGERYFAELLAAKLRSRGIKVGGIVSLGKQVPLDAEFIYQHLNSHSLHTILRGALEYSNNFIANQLFLLLGIQAPNDLISEHSSRLAMTQFLQSKYGNLRYWQDFTIEEGAGLSRENRLSAKQILDVLRDFEPHKRLLKSYQNDSVNAKTGTLSGVRTFAGYIDVVTLQGIKQYYFVFLFNKLTPYRYRERLLDDLVVTLTVN